ncbi:MAG: hypothetical protein ACTSWX_10935 [Promethearchaeota archaeon]
MNSDNIQPETSPHPKSNVAVVLLVGALSMFFAEVMAGSSNLWFLDPFGILSTYVLYLGHVLLYLNLAIRFKRTSLVQLYLWGMLFGLYEGPITQVLWSGYMDSTGPPIVLLGVASFEFIVLVFFWHPIMSFIIPVLVYEAIVVGAADKDVSPSEFQDLILPGHLDILIKLKSKKLWIFLIMGILAVDQIHASGFDVLVGFGAFVGSMVLIFILWKLALHRRTRINKPLSIKNLKFGSKGFLWLIIFMLVYVYVGISLLITSILPGRWPSNPIAYITLIVFAGIILLVLRSSPAQESIGSHLEEKKSLNQDRLKNIFSNRDLWQLFLVILGGAVFFEVFPSITMTFFVYVYFSMIVLGIILVIIAILSLKRLHTKFKAKKD